MKTFEISNNISLEYAPYSLIDNISAYYISIGSDNGLAPNRWQAIVCSNDEPAHKRIHMFRLASMC